MKKILLTFFTFFVSSSLFTQLNLFPPIGNVGIGTTSPTEKLTVNGSMSVQSLTLLNGEVKIPNLPLVDNTNLGNTLDQYKLLLIDENGVVRRVTAETPIGVGEVGDSPCTANGTRSRWYYGAYKTYIACPEVNVGISTTTPRVKLDVLGTTYSKKIFLGDLEETNNQDILFYLKANSNSALNGTIFNVNNSENSSVFSITNNGIIHNKNLWVDNNLNGGKISANNQLAVGFLLNPTNENYLLITDNTNESNKHGILSKTFHSSDYGYNTKLLVNRDNTKAFAIFNNSTGSEIETFKIYGDGRMQIGKETQLTGNHTNSKLTVNGKIVSQSLFITMNNWADYVFDENYELPKLTEIEQFYKLNKHLPEIPSEKEIIEKGLDVAEMNKLLLKKIEELTILLVEQEKRISQLEKNK